MCTTFLFPGEEQKRKWTQFDLVKEKIDFLKANAQKVTSGLRIHSIKRLKATPCDKLKLFKTKT